MSRADVLDIAVKLDGVRALPAKGDVYRRTWRAAASQEGCQFPADDKGKGKEMSLLATSNV
jgi:hypothetical protein